MGKLHDGVREIHREIRNLVRKFTPARPGTPGIWNTRCSVGCAMTAWFAKSLLLSVSGLGIAAAGLFCATEIGLQVDGWHAVSVELRGSPGYAAVGQTYTAPDGSRFMVTSVSRGKGDRHLVHAKVEGTHRYAVDLASAKIRHCFSLDRPSVEWTLRQAAGQPPAPLERAPNREWIPLD